MTCAECGTPNTDDARFCSDCGAELASISLTGSIDSFQNVEMYGYDDNGTQIDVFKGRFVTSSRIEGQWSKPNGSRSLPFTLIQQH